MTRPRPLQAATMLLAWEAGSFRPPIERALALLCVGYPDINPATAATLPISERDLRLLDLRHASFGSALLGYQDCACCGQRMEYTLDANDLRPLLLAAADAAVCEMICDGAVLRLRQANSADLALALREGDAQARLTVLVGQCVQLLDGDDIASLPTTTYSTALQRLQTMHEAAEISIRGVCAACGGAQSLVFDIAAFLWAEVRRHAESLLDEVHELALAYGWAEDAILAMPTGRRQAYLERVRA